MKKYLIPLALITLIGSFSVAHANQYPTVYTGSDAAYWQQYYGSGYSLKQQQDKDALEYRLNSLQAQIQGDPQTMISTIDGRITALQTQRDQEINVMRDTYANHGIMIQFDSKLAEINTNYDSQISTLQQQKSNYASQIANEQQRQQQIADLKKQIENVDKETDAAEQKIKDDLSAKNQALIDARDAASSYTGRIPTAQEAFDYIDSLSLHDASVAFEKLDSINPDLASQTKVLYMQKYPHGKPGTAVNEDYRASLKATQTTPKVVKPSSAPKKTFFDDISTTTASTTTIKSDFAEIFSATTTASSTSTSPDSIKTPPTPLQPQPEGFVGKVFTFFKRLAFWR